MSSPMALPSSSVGIEAQLIHDFDAVTAVTATLLALSTVAVAGRCYVRGHITHTFGADDWTMVAAWFCWLITSALCFVATKAEKLLVQDGILEMSMNALVQLIRYTNISYSLTMIVVKISIGIFFLKLFTKNFKWQRILVYVLVAISTTFGAVYLIMTWASCGIMVRSQATTAMHTGSDWCPIQDTFVIISIVWSVLNAITDITFQALSIHVLWHAKLNRATKTSAALLLVLGSIGGIASIARIAVQTPLQDIRMSGVLLGLWSNVEAGLCITAASLITLRPLFHSCLERTKSTIASMSAKSNEPKRTASQSTEEFDLEQGKSKGGVIITKTWEVKDKDVDEASRDGSIY